MAILGGFRQLPHGGGFTLVELVVVLVLAGILAFAALPRFFSTQTFRERGFYDEALSAARYAQKYAVSSGCEVQFSVSASAYVLNQRVTNCTTGAFTRAVVNPGSNAATFTGTAPSGITFTMSPGTVVFDALGRTADATVTVGTRSFQIMGATGFVQE